MHENYQNKTTMRYYFTSTRMLTKKKKKKATWKITSVGEVGDGTIVHGDVKWNIW